MILQVAKLGMGEGFSLKTNIEETTDCQDKLKLLFRVARELLNSRRVFWYS